MGQDLNLSEFSFSSVSHAYRFSGDVKHTASSTAVAQCVHKRAREREEGGKEEFHVVSAISPGYRER